MIFKMCRYISIQVAIPPLFPPKKENDLPAPKPLFPNIAPRKDPPEHFSSEPPHQYNTGTPDGPAHWSDQRERVRHFQRPPDEGFPHSREQWRGNSPPHSHYTHRDTPLWVSSEGNFDRDNFYRDGSPFDHFDEDRQEGRFCEGPPRPHFRPRRPDFSPPAPRPDLGGERRHNIDRGNCYPISDRGHRVSPTRQYFYNDRPPDLNFTPSSPGFDERPPDFGRERPQDFNRSPDFERAAEFNRPPDFTRPPDFARPPEFARPPDMDRPQGFHDGDDFRNPSPPAFHHDNLVENFTGPPEDHQWLGNQSEGDLRHSPCPRRPEFHDPTDGHHRMPLLPTPCTLLVKCVCVCVCVCILYSTCITTCIYMYM